MEDDNSSYTLQQLETDLIGALIKDFRTLNLLYTYLLTSNQSQ